MGDLFNEYNSQIQGFLDSIKSRLKLCQDNPDSTNNGLYITELEGFISSAEETLRQMELEARTSNDLSSYDRLEQVKNIRNFLKDATDTTRNLQMEMQRKNLLGDVSSYTNTQEFKTFSKNREMLDKGLMFIKTSCDVVDEAGRLGQDASLNLSQQRGVISNLSAELIKAKFSLSGADEYLCSLVREGRINRVILNTVKIAIASTFVIIVLIRLVKFFMFFKPK